MKKFILSSFGLGFLPVAPGTWGSLLPVGLFLAVHHFWPNAGILLVLLAAVTILSSIACVALAGSAEKIANKKDPGWTVIDEVAGQSVALLPAVFAGKNIFLICAAAFVLFRIFDILKPWPVKNAEKLPGGFGILFDDILAGIYAAAALMIILQFKAVLWAVGLGTVQGLTEFLPVSSDGHLVLLQKIFGFDTETPQMLLFDLSVHIGTLVSIFIVFRKSIMALTVNCLKAIKNCQNPIELYKKNLAFKLFFLAGITVFVTGVLGLLFKDYFESVRGNMPMLAICWVVNGVMLMITDMRKETRMGLRQFGITIAIIIGVAQAAAILPSISRSGATICAAILLGLHRRWAVEFSFLVAIPTILAATVVELLGNLDVIHSAALPMAALIIGPITAAIVGIAALQILIKASRKANLKYFAFYCFALAAGVIVYILLK
ncbi:MAG: phosphatidylglycerophosphatase A [Phycisphaerae bacterium]